MINKLSVLVIATLLTACATDSQEPAQTASPETAADLPTTQAVTSTATAVHVPTQPATDVPTQTATAVPTQTATDVPTQPDTDTPQKPSCTADDPDEFGNIVNWCDDGSYWWIDSVVGMRFDTDASGNTTTTWIDSDTGTRYDTDASGNTTTGQTNNIEESSTNTGPIVDLSESVVPSSDWGRNPSDFSLRADFGACAAQSGYSIDKLSSKARANLELITGMNMADVTAQDLGAVTQLDFADENFWEDEFVQPASLVSYDGLEYLTCLQWLGLGYQQPPLSRDFRFLKSLTELRYLDLSGTAFTHVEFLLPLKKLETIVLPASFPAVSDLAKITSLRRISAPAAPSCNIESVLNMPNLEAVLLGGKNYSGAGSYHQWKELNELNRDFNVSLATVHNSPTGRYLQLLVKGGAQAFNPEPFTPESANSYQDPQYVMDVVQSIYDVVEDDYDVIVFVGNVETSTASYSGQATQISNNIEGLGVPIWSTAECYGSEGRLRGVISLPSIGSLWTEEWGTGNTLIHEILHLWGGADLLPVMEDFGGEFTGGHWGVSSANGLLGGFDAKELETIDDGVYRTNYFWDAGNSEPDRSLSALELYMMGVLSASEVPDIIVFSGVSQLNDDNTCEAYGYESWEGACFRATEQTSLSIEDITDVFGERPYEGELDISLLVVAVSEEPLTDSEWSRLDQHISRFADTQPRDDLCEKTWETCHNMWAASEGKITVRTCEADYEAGIWNCGW